MRHRKEGATEISSTLRAKLEVEGILRKKVVRMDEEEEEVQGLNCMENKAGDLLELTPCAPIPGSRIAQFMQPW